MTADPVERSVVGVSPDFPVEFEDPALAKITWEWDDMHMPFALAPLAGQWARIIGDGFTAWREGHDVAFPQRTFNAIWNGYAYYGFDPGAEGERRAKYRAIAVEIWRAHEAVAERDWQERWLPELREIYRSMMEAPIERGSRAEAAEAWQRAWAGAARAWQIHFIAINGAYQVMDDLADLYESVTPGTSPGESGRLIHGGRHELYDLALGMDRLTDVTRSTPAVATALRAGSRSRSDLAALPGGPAFDAELDAFLAIHGHMGQSVDDLMLASWIEEPALLLAELAKRLDHSPEPAEARRERLAREADELADGVRARIAGDPEKLAEFERLLALARRIGHLTEVHNYWIDRAAQSHLRRFLFRVGARLVREGVVAQPADVFYFERDEVPALLLDPEDRRDVIAERRARHERQKTLKPPRYVGKAPEPESGPADRFEGAKADSGEGNELKGTGASAGVVRGPARVVLTSNEFDRIQPGDVIVCPSSNPSWVPVFTIAGGLVTNTGGVLSHAAVVAREFGLPAVVGVTGATTKIPDGREVEIDGTAGTVRLL